MPAKSAGGRKFFILANWMRWNDEDDHEKVKDEGVRLKTALKIAKRAPSTPTLARNLGLFNKWDMRTDGRDTTGCFECDTRLKLGEFFQIVPGFDLPSDADRFGHARPIPMSEVCSIQRLIDWETA